jgi:hypothetical protein
MMTMTTRELILRCYCERSGDIWQAFCIDLNLATQGDSPEEVKRKLHEQINSFVYDALVGEDKEYAEQLLKRKAPLEFRLKYHCYKASDSINNTKDKICSTFNEIMPVGPIPCNA